MLHCKISRYVLTQNKQNRDKTGCRTSKRASELQQKDHNPRQQHCDSALFRAFRS
jgi:hypothetical protein